MAVLDYRIVTSKKTEAFVSGEDEAIDVFGKAR
jgi:hypothetical protein